jgi:hypothetical protein
VSLVLGRLQRWRSRARVQAAAQARLRATERAVGRRVSRGEWRVVRRYAQEVLGDGRYALELARYTLAAGEFRPGWIPDRFMARVVVPHVNPLVAPIARSRTLTQSLFPTLSAPHLLSLVAGAWWDASGERLDVAAAHARLFADAAEVVMKDDGSVAGGGFRLVQRGDDLAAWAARGVNAVFQRRIVQHPLFDAFVPGGATTLRVVTVDRAASGAGSGVEARVARLQIPAFGSWYSRSRGHVFLGVDPTTGVTVSVARDRDYRPYLQHPDTGAPFGSFPVPGIATAMAAAVRWHEGFPWAGLLGWDFVIDPQGVPWPIECNGLYPSLAASEIVTGPDFADLGWERLRPRRA